MSRIGKKPIPIPSGVKIQVSDGAVEVQGPKGKLRQALPPGIAFKLEDASLVASQVREDKELGKFHGLARSLVANAVTGVTQGFKRELDIVGVGYRAELKGKQVIFALARQADDVVQLDLLHVVRRLLFFRRVLRLLLAFLRGLMGHASLLLIATMAPLEVGCRPSPASCSRCGQNSMTTLVAGLAASVFCVPLSTAASAHLAHPVLQDQPWSHPNSRRSECQK
jgi:hypothetical protein